MFIGEDGQIHEECGVFGIYAKGCDVAQLTYFGLFALQHRGQEGCGIAVENEDGIAYKRGLGLVTEVFNTDNLGKLKGDVAIGHVRYSTTGQNTENNVQPMVGYYEQGQIALAHNGNLANTEELRERLSRNGAVFQAKLDAARDPYGNRPLCLGKYKDGYVVASESCALTTIGAEFIRDLLPGEVIVIDDSGITSYMPEFKEKPKKAHCIFEYVYFARPDSTLDGINVNVTRRQMGAILAKEIQKLDVDIVIPVPDSGTTAAIGFAEAQGLTFTQGILKNRYAGRTFIQPTQALRELMVNLKLNPIFEEIGGKRVAVVDDSIVRGTTSKRLIERLRESGAKEVHFLVTCPPVTHSCFYGIDTGNRDTLIGATHSLEEIAKYINADSLHFLSLEGLLESVGGSENFCTACLDGKYHMGTPKDYKGE